MSQRFLIWGFASITFVVTLAVTSWHNGLWQQSDDIAPPAHNIRSAALTTDESTDLPARPFAPTRPAQPAPVETVAAVTPPPPLPDPAPQEAPPPDQPAAQVSAQELDEADFQDHRDRAAEHSSRTR